MPPTLFSSVIRQVASLGILIIILSKAGGVVDYMEEKQYQSPAIEVWNFIQKESCAQVQELKTSKKTKASGSRHSRPVPFVIPDPFLSSFPT